MSNPAANSHQRFAVSRTHNTHTHSHTAPDNISTAKCAGYVAAHYTGQSIAICSAALIVCCRRGGVVVGAAFGHAFQIARNSVACLKRRVHTHSLDNTNIFSVYTLYYFHRVCVRVWSFGGVSSTKFPSLCAYTKRVYDPKTVCACVSCTHSSEVLNSRRLRVRSSL